MTTAHERRLARDRQQRCRERKQGKIPQVNQRAPQSIPMGVVQDLGIKMPKDGLRIAVIPDVQAMPGVPMEHLTWCGEYLARKQPDVVVCIGDFGDFPSLSHFEQGTVRAEGRRWKNDLGAFHKAMTLLRAPMERVPSWKPQLVYTLGNHEDHINRAANEDTKFSGEIADLKLESYGWRVHPFLQPVAVGGVAFCHYFPSGVMGKPITRASMILSKLHMSAVAGHQQGKDIAFSRRADGGHMAAIITGSFYQHDYSYLSPFTNAHWRGMLMLHEVKDGAFDEMFVSINFLKRKFG